MRILVMHIYKFLIARQQGKINKSSTLHLLQQMYLDRYGHKLRCCPQLVFSSQTARGFFVSIFSNRCANFWRTLWKVFGGDFYCFSLYTISSYKKCVFRSPHKSWSPVGIL